MFFDDCKKWQEKPPNEQTWDNFKAHFLQAQDQLRLQQTAKQTGYFGTILDKHLSAQCIRIIEATNNFLAATQQHEQDLSTISASQTAFSAQTERLEQMLTTITNRLETLEKARSRPNNNNNYKRKDHGSYCWTHGYQTCRKKSKPPK